MGLGLLATFLTNLSEGVAGFGDRLKYIPFMAFSGAGNRDKESQRYISERYLSQRALGESKRELALRDDSGGCKL